MDATATLSYGMKLKADVSEAIRRPMKNVLAQAHPERSAQARA